MYAQTYSISDKSPQLLTLTREASGFGHYYTETLTNPSSFNLSTAKVIYHGKLSVITTKGMPSLGNWVNIEPTNWFETENYYLPTQDTTSSSLKYTPQPGTDQYVKSSIGKEMYNQLSKSDKTFLREASNMFNLGTNVDIFSIVLSIKNGDFRK
jgi:hypothetical protein